MDPLDSRINTELRINIELVIEQERKLMDILRVASVTVNGKDPIFATLMVWILGNGYIPQYMDHVYHEGELVLMTWSMGIFIGAGQGAFISI